MDLPLLAAEYALGMLHSEDLPDIAVELLIAGNDSKSFACLAGSRPFEYPVDLKDLFEAGLEECSTAIPRRLEAASLLILHSAGEMAERRLPPSRGIEKIADIYRAVRDLLPPSETYVGESLGIARLLGLYYSLDDLQPDDPLWHDIELEIVRECQRIIAGPPAPSE